jgi:hypothetical protein
MTAMSELSVQDPYRVKRGDTLSKLAKRCGKTVPELIHLNKLDNPNRLDEGQTLYLSRETAFGVSVLFLDALRHPIENLRYKIRFDGQISAGQTVGNGAAGRVTTKDAKSVVEVLVQDLQGQWAQVCKTASDHGHKLITLVSGALVFPGSTREHPKNAPAKPASDEKRKASGKASGEAGKNNPNVKTKKSKGKHGQGVIQITVDIPEGLQRLFDLYKNDPITVTQWADVADSLGCEAAVLKAIAEVKQRGQLTGGSTLWMASRYLAFCLSDTGSVA